MSSCGQSVQCFGLKLVNSLRFCRESSAQLLSSGLVPGISYRRQVTFAFSGLDHPAQAVSLAEQVENVWDPSADQPVASSQVLTRLEQYGLSLRRSDPCIKLQGLLMRLYDRKHQ